MTTATISLEGGEKQGRRQAGIRKRMDVCSRPALPTGRLRQSLNVHGLSQGSAPPTEMTLFPVAFWSGSAALR